MNLKEWLKQHQIVVKDIRQIECAFVHRSYLHEHQNTYPEDNQRLEFMGDAVLQLWTASYLYNLNPKLTEGNMTKLRSQMVCESSLAKIAFKLGLNEFLKLGHGEVLEQGQMRDSTVADMFEAFLGALYLESGYQYVSPLLTDIFKDLEEFKQFNSVIDFKTELQEYVQADNRRTISYVLLSVDGPSNQRIFETSVQIDGITYGKGKGSSKKRAEQAAAKEALTKLVK
ncbi:MAG TPA: ribonuclease III [Erysipelotrichaceae bacterium]|nr:ribonuclease III [Erysipelotrichaceae bacterium]